MHDMLVRLVRLRAAEPLVRRVWEESGVLVRPCRSYELHLLQRWIHENFSPKWVSEATVAVCHCPPACFITTQRARIVGVGPADFYRKVVGATDIEESTPGIYEDILNEG